MSDGNTQGESTPECRKLDPETTPVPELLKAMWEMMKKIEEVAGPRSFAIFPEASIDLNFLWLDATTIVRLFRTLRPDHRCFAMSMEKRSKAKILGPRTS